MEPKLPTPNFTPEANPQQYGQSIESLPLPPSPETGFERGERPMEQQGEAVPIAVNAAPPVLPTPIPVTLPAPAVSDPVTSAASDDAPLVAADDDLIEKEWVDRAKKIISETRDDPHRREQEVSKLQADYLKKRYGKELGASD
jgi:hypothetical protein